VQIEYSTFSLQKRLLVLVMLITFIFCAVAVRLFFLQGFSSSELQARAAEQWVRTLPLTARRGDIIDATGSVLATSFTTYDVYVRAKNVKDPIKVARFLTDLLELNYQRLHEKVLNRSISEVLIKLDVSREDALKIIQERLDGVVLSENISRFYPYGNFLSQVLGFMSVDNVGQAGVEAFYNTFLRGTNGRALSQGDVKGIDLEGSPRYYVPSIPGLNLQLTIDSKIQLIVEQVMAELVAEHRPKSVSVIMMEIKTGKILSMALTPSLDNNNLPRDNVQRMMELSKNSMVVDVYEPGSTFKILTAAAALAEGLTTFEEKFHCPGFRVIDGERVKCWKTIGHGTQTLVEGIANSCNCVFMDLGVRLGVDRLYSYMRAFGIGTATGVDILGESNGMLLPQNSVRTVDIARIAFGHAVAVNELQLLTAFCAALNGGTLMRPYLADNIYNDSGLILKQNKPTLLNNVISKDISAQVGFLLSQVLNLKGGAYSWLPGYDMGGKTGTAQKYKDGVIDQGKYVSSFFGVYPTKDPQYALLLCVDEPASGVYYGSIVAAPYGRKIFERFFEYKNILPDNPLTQPKFVTMPNLIGFTLVQAIMELERLGVRYEVSGSGFSVTRQIPAANTQVLKSSTVLIAT
jgi:stage V sporulation protein D (sporulation-specific penicillin-binding protein)